MFAERRKCSKGIFRLVVLRRSTHMTHFQSEMKKQLLDSLVNNLDQINIKDREIKILGRNKNRIDQFKLIDSPLFFLKNDFY